MSREQKRLKIQTQGCLLLLERMYWFMLAVRARCWRSMLVCFDMILALRALIRLAYQMV